MRPHLNKVLIGTGYLEKAISASSGKGVTIALDLETTGLSVYESKVTWISWCIGDIYGAIPILHRNFITNDGVHLQIEKRPEPQQCGCEQVNALRRSAGDHHRENLCLNWDLKEVKAIVSDLHKNKANTVIWHNAKFDLSILISNGWFTLDDIRATIFDPLLASYVLNPIKDREKGTHALKALYNDYLRSADEAPQPEYIEVANGLKFEDARLDEAAFYSAFDAFSAFHLFKKLNENLNADPISSRYFSEIEMRHLLTTIEMTVCGMRLLSQSELDDKGLKTIPELEHDLELQKRKIFKMVGFTFNFDSPNSLRGVLFGKLRIKPLDRNRKSNTSRIDTATLAKILRLENARKDADPRLIEIISHVMYAKRLTEIIKKHREMYQHVNSITKKNHANFRSTTASGRYAASKPNVLSLPSMTGIKEHIAAAPGNTFVIADFSQIDLRVIANETWEINHESKMLASVNRGDDLHLSTLRIVRPDLNIPAHWIKIDDEKKIALTRCPSTGNIVEEQVGDNLSSFLNAIARARKDVAKQVNFGISYGLSASSLLENLNSPKEYKDNVIGLAKHEISREQLLQRISAIEPKVYSEDEIADYLMKFHRAYPGIRDFQQRVESDLQASGYTRNLFGKLCKTEVASHFLSGTFDIAIEYGMWYRTRLKVLNLDDKFIYGILLNVAKLEVKEPKGKKNADIRNFTRTERFQIYDLDADSFDVVIADFLNAQNATALMNGLDGLHKRANWDAEPFLRHVKPHTPKMCVHGKLIELWPFNRYPFVRLSHHSIKFVWNREKSCDLYYPGYDQLKRNLVSARIQSASMDFAKIAMFTFREEARKRWPDLKMRPRIVNCIHDEIAIECAQDQSTDVKNLLLRCMSDKENFGGFVADGRHLEVDIGAEERVGPVYKKSKG